MWWELFLPAKDLSTSSPVLTGAEGVPQATLLQDIMAETVADAIIASGTVFTVRLPPAHKH